MIWCEFVGCDYLGLYMCRKEFGDIIVQKHVCRGHVSMVRHYGMNEEKWKKDEK